MKHLFLFDVDGVLVEARGYVKALQDTVAHFAGEMRLGDGAPTQEEIRAFEANGLTSEWDSGGMCVMALLLARLDQGSGLDLPADWSGALAALAAQPSGGAFQRPDFAALADRVGARIRAGTSSTEAVRAVLADEARALPAWGCYQPALGVLFEALLGHTHDFYRAPVTRHFQHLVLGSRAVTETYGVPPDFESSAYLSRYDRPLLAPAVGARLRACLAAGRARGVVYTLRPSLPPADADSDTSGYSPEAEMARSLVDLEGLPLVGQGRMRWLARQTGEPEPLSRLVKPSPVQALAAVGAAGWEREPREAAALEAALRLYRRGRLEPPLAGLGPSTVHVFEDSLGGLRAVERGVERLRAAGADVRWQPYGVAPPGGVKAAALAAQSLPVYASVNEAILTALAQLEGGCLSS